MNEFAIKETTDSNIGIPMSIAVMTYGISAYSLGVAGLSVLIFAVAGIIPFGLLGVVSDSPFISALLNIGLLTLFGLQHSVMARQSFKDKLYQVIPRALERSTFVWTSGAVLAFITLAWQPLPGYLWQSTGTLNTVLWAGFAFGWTYLLAATFAINHWDLFGLRQTWLASNNIEYSQVAFKEHWMYRYSRHPIMLGVLIGVWCVPAMSWSTFSLSAGLTLYIFVGLYFEERDLIRQWGREYREYQQRVRALLPLRK